MERLLSGVREISIIDARVVREDVHPVDVGALLAMLVDGFRVRERERLRFELETGGGPLTVMASEDRLTQVFENILDNAASFSPRGGTVRVRAHAEEGAVVVRVADEGPGIPEANLYRIFDRFFTHRPEGARVAAGHTGLGLAIVQAIVEAYGGRVAAENGERGAVFTVRLPRRA